MIRRREAITLLGGAAAWPVAARAQQRERMRRIGVLIDIGQDDAEGQLRIAAFRHGLQDLGWSEGRNVQIDYRWFGGDVERRQAFAAELVGLKPDAIFAGNASALVAVRKATSTVPIVFVQVNDPVAGGFAASLARPGGNTTGFALFEFASAAKWVELLREFAPRTVRIGVLYELSNSGKNFLPPIESALGPSVQMLPCALRSRADIEDAIDRVAGEPNGALIVLGGPLTAVHRDLIVIMAARHRLPTVSPYRYFAAAGALFSYGPDTIDQYRLAAGYIDRILKGDKPGDLPIQFPTKLNLVINLKTAKALGFEVPPTLLARANEVIE
jgi:putative tryptophan/tyrosine transport system substrate-binding protein